MLIRDLNNLNQLIVDRLPDIRRIPFDVIVHLPRSGTIPASIIATYIKAPFASVDEFCNGFVNTRRAEYKTLNKILVVDDSIRTGQQMKEAVERIRAARPDAEIFTLSIYGTIIPDRIFEATLVLSEHKDCDYIYPWFMWKTKKIKKCAVDIDGVLCRDCRPEEDDDGEKYLEFLANADLKFKPDAPIGAIVTGRLEKYRPQTVAWLKKHGIEYKELIMGPWNTKAERKLDNVGKWKGKVFKRANKLSLFIESSVREAEEICLRSKKVVWCVDNQRVYKI